MYSLSCLHFNRDAVNYVKWQLLRGEYSNYAYAIQSINSDIFRKIEYPVSPELDASNDLTCARLVEEYMPLAIARPFVEEFITKDLIHTVSVNIEHLYLDYDVIPKVNETANQIQKAFVQRVMGKDWLDKFTKDQCVEKVCREEQYHLISVSLHYRLMPSLDKLLIRISSRLIRNLMNIITK